MSEQKSDQSSKMQQPPANATTATVEQAQSQAVAVGQQSNQAAQATGAPPQYQLPQHANAVNPYAYYNAPAATPGYALGNYVPMHAQQQYIAPVYSQQQPTGGQQHPANTPQQSMGYAPGWMQQPAPPQYQGWQPQPPQQYGMQAQQGIPMPPGAGQQPQPSPRKQVADNTAGPVFEHQGKPAVTATGGGKTDAGGVANIAADEDKNKRRKVEAEPATDPANADMEAEIGRRVALAIGGVNTRMERMEKNEQGRARMHTLPMCDALAKSTTITHSTNMRKVMEGVAAGDDSKFEAATLIETILAAHANNEQGGTKPGGEVTPPVPASADADKKPPKARIHLAVGASVAKQDPVSDSKTAEREALNNVALATIRNGPPAMRI